MSTKKMKWIRICLALTIALVFISSPSFASHEIMRWRDNRTAAVSLTFDDGYVSQYTTVADLLNARNFKGTFFLATERVQPLGGWEPWQELAEQGHEIASHTITHAHLLQLSETEVREELSESQIAINLNIPNQSCLTFAYPYGEQNEYLRTITSEYYIAARGVMDSGSSNLNYYPGGPYPLNFYYIRSYNVDSRPFEEIQNQVNLVEESNAWLTCYTHDVGSGYVSVLSAFYDDLLTRDIWVDTVGAIVRYMQERIYSTLAVISESETEIILNLTHSLDNSIFNFPLTTRSTVPSAWSVVHIYQAGSEQIIAPVIENGEAVVYYDAVPNAGLITLSPGSSDNQPPAVNAGSDLTIFLPDNSVLLDGTVADDGLPNPPAEVTTTWSQVSGPGTVAFDDANELNTTATFSDAGTYVLELTADDGEVTASDEVTIEVIEEGAQGYTLDVRVATGSDDAEEYASGDVNITSEDLELVNDGSDQTVGIRFVGVDIPQGATILNAYVQFQVDETGSDATSLIIEGEDIDDALAFASSIGNISSRIKTQASVLWSPLAWSTAGDAGPDQQTPDISQIIQEIVNRADWVSGNSLAVIITGTGKRVAEAYEGDQGGAPLLHVEYAEM